MLHFFKILSMVHPFFYKSSTLSKQSPFMSLFVRGNKKKSRRARSGEQGVWSKEVMPFNAMNLHLIKNVTLHFISQLMKMIFNFYKQLNQMYANAFIVINYYNYLCISFITPLNAGTSNIDFYNITQTSQQNKHTLVIFFRFWKLNVQIIARYLKWSKDLLDKVCMYSIHKVYSNFLSSEISNYG